MRPNRNVWWSERACRVRHAARRSALGWLCLGLSVLLSGGALHAETVEVLPERSSSRPIAPRYTLHEDGGVSVRICFNWSCARRETLTFTATEMSAVRGQMGLCPAADLYSRLQRLRLGVWQMETLAQKYQPLLGRDKGVNDRDPDGDGRMDCVDNATNTNTYLRVLAELGLLDGWRIGDPEVRDALSSQVHWTAAIEDERSGERWAVDSWFRPNGHLPFVTPIDAWSSGLTPWEPPFSHLNRAPRYSYELCEAVARERQMLLGRADSGRDDSGLADPDRGHSGRDHSGPDHSGRADIADRDPRE
ncbi:MAG: hypothetical protein KDK91_33630 [Gammaproteobacteria bacterium]|nr:hypothetical protein [Gammaproteobacteria bacterium]